ncbi:hypothetical protein L7F22_050506 [Adiantum nelumboides]|nr:hypothetical protein [Adiantum nelumboides]
MGGDMYPLPRQVLTRSNDYGIDIKGEEGTSGLTQEEKGKTKVISVVTLENAAGLEDTLVMPIGKRTTQNKEGRNTPGDGQLSYDLKEDLTSRKADVTFGQLLEMVPKLKHGHKEVLEESYEDEDESSDEDCSTVFDKDSDSTTSSDEDVDVAFLLMDKEIHDSGLIAFANEIDHESEGPYEVIEGLIQTKVMPTVVTTIVQDDGLRQDMRQVVDLIKYLSLNMLGNVGNNRVQGKFANQPRTEERPRNDVGQSNGRIWRQTPTCYNSRELDHISPQCKKPPRMGGDMYPLPRQVLTRSNDYGIDIKGEEGTSGLTQEEKKKTKVISVVTLENAARLEDTLAMPIGKRATQNKEGRNTPGPNKKEGKSHEDEDVKAKSKRRTYLQVSCYRFSTRGWAIKL